MSNLIKLFLLSAICQTGGQAKQFILEGKVKVNGAIELKRGKKLHKNDIIEVDGKTYIIK